MNLAEDNNIAKEQIDYILDTKAKSRHRNGELRTYDDLVIK